MYRFTKRHPYDASVMLTKEAVRLCHNPQRVYENVLVRLAEYEDTGLLPEEIMEHRLLIASEKNQGLSDDSERLLKQTSRAA